MNSYDENLRSAVVASLQAQELDHKKTKAQKNASLFTLYYAEGATIMAMEQLKVTEAALSDKTDVKTQAVISSNISNNVLRSATQVSQDLGISASAVSVAAANIQVASTAIVKLASDLGSIYGIANAANFDSEIFKQTDKVRQLMDMTAYEAEQASQFAMEASVSTSEVSVSAIKDKAKVTNDYMSSVLKIASDEFNSTSAIVASVNAALAAASGNEKVAEGVFRDVSVEYNASTNAYLASNKELNLDLRLPKEQRSTTSFTVVFNAIKTPFGLVKTPYYPVKNYYLLVVKDSKKTVFSISNAENLVQNKEAYFKRFVTVPMPAPPKPASGSEGQNATQPFSQLIEFKAMPWAGTADPKTYDSSEPDYDNAESTSDFYTLRDSDGDKIELGQKYVVFVMAVYTDDYKQNLNNFSDFLSAPSGSFRMTTRLGAADGKSIKIAHVKEDAAARTEAAYQLSFDVKENPYNKVEYRCIFLPDNDNPLSRMLSTELLDKFNNDVTRMVNISNEMDPEITALTAQVEDMQASVTALTGKLNDLTAEREAINKNTALAPKEKQQQLTQNRKDQQETTQETVKQNAQLAVARKKLNTLVAKRNTEQNSTESAGGNDLGFLFNLKLAEQVAAGNYISIKPWKKFDEAISAAVKEGKPVTYTTFNFTANIEDGVTDNFGTPLLPDSTYIPVIVSVCSVEEENPEAFSSSWSGYNSSTPFIYNPTLTKKK